MVFFLLQTHTPCTPPLQAAHINAAATPVKESPNQSLGRRSEPAHAARCREQKIGNSQSDGIAANHSRKLTMQLGFEQSVALLSAEHAKTR